MDSQHLTLWIIFHITIAIMLYIDLFLAQKNPHAVSIKEAAAWSVIWILVSLLFATGVGYFLGSAKGMEFLAGYLLEKALSVDNMFVFILIFSYFDIARQYQPRVLKWGIVGALVLRLVFILAGVSLIKNFHWTIYVLGALLIYTGLKIGFEGEKEVEPDKNFLLKIFKKFIPFTHEMDGSRFWTKKHGRWMATPLLATLIVVEASDVVFAIDSIPAILAITQDTFIVYTSNAFAILGLRALYFLLSGIITLFRFLSVGVAGILVLVGAKMLASDFYHVPITTSLALIGGILAVSIIASILFPAKPPILEHEKKAIPPA